MGWSGRAPAPPVSEPCQGRQSQGARYVSATQHDDPVIGVDIGKNSFHVVGLDQRGAIVLRQKWSRGPADAGEVRSPLFEGTEERFPRRGGDRRGGATANDEVCGDEDRRSARSAGAASSS